MARIASIFIGFLLDMLLGDPIFKYHPIRIIGRGISFFENIIRRYAKSDRDKFFGGVLLMILVLSVCFLVSFSIIFVARKINVGASMLIESIIIWFMLAAKSLKAESMAVYEKLKKNDIKAARNAVSMIVGRDTQHLDEKGITKATVETIAENTSDGVIAPLFYMFLFGAVGGVIYKAVNTMDSMVGYHNERYEYFGKTAAKLDDVFNFIPARISALFMIIASFIIGMDYKNAWKIFKRDRLKHKSPNSAQTESVCAGALKIRLAGDACYFGKLVKKDYIGDEIDDIVSENIIDANKLMYMTTIISLIIFSLIAILVEVL